MKLTAKSMNELLQAIAELKAEVKRLSEAVAKLERERSRIRGFGAT